MYQKIIYQKVYDPAAALLFHRRLLENIDMLVAKVNEL
jgi:hypothetical protein